MNIKITHLFSLLMCMVCIAANAQDEMFKVLASKGANKVTAGAATSNVTIGKKLFKTDKVTVATGGYLGLAHTSGKTIEIKNAGTYDVAKLSSEVSAQNKGVCKKYVDFVVGEMTAQDEDMAKNKYKYMAVTGSVERGGDVAVLARDKELALNESIILRWLKHNDKDTFVVKLTNLFDEVILSDTITDYQYAINLGKYNFKSEKAIKWEVAPLKPSPVYAKKLGIISSIPDDKEIAIRSELKELKSEIGDETALNKFILANFYAQNNLYIDAVEYYHAAIESAPDVELYKNAYERFVLTKKLVSEQSWKTAK